MTNYKHQNTNNIQCSKTKLVSNFDHSYLTFGDYLLFEHCDLELQT